MSTRKKRPNPKRESDTLSNAKKRLFLLQYARTGNVLDAAAKARIGRRTHYDWLDSDEGYKRSFEDARADAIETLERECRRRATKKKAPSDVLLMFLLKKLDPSYRENYKIEHTGPGGGPMTVTVEFVKAGAR